MKILLASCLGASAVAAGAFGAHALKTRLPPELLATWNTGAHYHLVHAVVLLAVALFAQASGRSLDVAYRLLALGVLLFSGSLYALCLTGIRGLGAITPLGGLLLIVGWLALAWQLRRP